jgi:hypothetical protein
MTKAPGNEQSKIELNPHLEGHGHHAVEWSYHFPLNTIEEVEASLHILVPEEKASQRARESILSSIISHTRFSLANASSSADELSKAFLTDSLWIKNQLCRGGTNFCGIADLENSPVLLRCMRDDFSGSFLSRLTLILQSHLKRGARCAIRNARNLEHLAGDSEAITESLACFQAFDGALRSANNVLDATLVWRNLRNLVRTHPQHTPASANSNIEKLCAELEEISELIIMLMGKHIADTQDSFFRVLDRTVATEQFNECIEFIRKRLNTLSQWTSDLAFMRAQLGLTNLTSLSSDPELAARFFERSLELKRIHYRKWDLTTVLNPTPTLKEFSKTNFRRLLHLKGSKCEGTCTFTPPEVVQNPQMNSPCTFTVLNLERRTAWEKQGRDWQLHLHERFRPALAGKKFPTNSIKQLWRIPFDEILHTLDDTLHVLRLPSIEGRPVHVKTHKRVTFPFEIHVQTFATQGHHKLIADSCSLKGHIIVYGAQIVSIEINH